MYSKKEVFLLKKQLMAHFDSYPHILVELTGLTRPTINKFFSYDNSVRPSNQDLIYSAGIDLIKEKMKKRDERVNELEELCNTYNHTAVSIISK